MHNKKDNEHPPHGCRCQFPTCREALVPDIDKYEPGLRTAAIIKLNLLHLFNHCPVVSSEHTHISGLSELNKPAITSKVEHLLQ